MRFHPDWIYDVVLAALTEEKGGPAKIEEIGDLVANAGYCDAEEAEGNASAILNDLQVERKVRENLQTRRWALTVEG
jgi:hypothetical protein